MSEKKDTIFCFRWSSELDRIFRNYASYNGFSSGSLVRKILRQYLVAKSVINQGQYHD